MKKSRETLLKNIEVNKTLAGAAPEPAKEAEKEPELHPVMPELASRYNHGPMTNSIRDREADADYIRSHDPCFRDTDKLLNDMKNIRKDLEASGMIGGSSVEFKRMMRAFEDLEDNVIPGVPEEARFYKMNALILLKNATEDYINKKHFDADIDLDKELVPSTSVGKKHLRGAKDILTMVNVAIENMNQVAVNEASVKEEPLIPGDKKPEKKENINQEIVNEEPFNEETVNQEIVNEEPFNEETVNQEIVNEEPFNEETVNQKIVNEEPLEEEPLIPSDKESDIEKKQEQKAPEEKKEEPYTIQRQLKEAQEKISGFGEQINAEKLARPLSQIITCHKITGLQKQGHFRNITKEEFDKIENVIATKDPIVKEMLKRTVPKELASQALNDKGQNLFANYQRTSIAVNEERKRKAENNPTVVNNKELDSSQLGGFHKQ